MNVLLGLSRGIDRLNDWVGRTFMWIALAMVLVGAYNAVVRALDKQIGTNLSNNTWLELQWYMFAAVFLLLAGYTMLHNGHVRVDVFYSRMSLRQQAWIDLLGAVLFVIPLCLLLLYVCIPFVQNSIGWFNQGRWEYSNDPGGLIRWPVKALLIPGFVLLALQAFSEAIKNLAYLRGALPGFKREAEGEVA
ncbi:MAG: TRAP transporter small permease subunit [Meiothermus sp.]|nr:TRAP transporter small permease subunit [Meiothermus sp.]